MKRKRRIGNAVLMLCLTAGVIAVGFFSADCMRGLLPSFKEEIVPMEDKKITQKLYGDNDQLSLYPWIYYNPEDQMKLYDDQRKELDDYGFSDALSWMLEEKPEFTHNFTENITFGSIGGQAAIDKYIQQPLYGYVLFGKDQVITGSDGIRYQVDYAANETIVYYHQQPENREPVHREHLEHAYRVLANLISKEKGEISGAAEAYGEEELPDYLLVNYLKRINTSTGIYQTNMSYYPYPLLDLEYGRNSEGYVIRNDTFNQCLLYEFNDIKELYMTDQELMLEMKVTILRTFEKEEKKLVLFFDPVLLEFCGFSFQNEV